MKKRLLLITFSVVFIILIILFIKSKTKIKTKPSEEISVSTIQTKYNQISIPIETFGSVIYQTKNEITNLVAGTVIEKKVKEILQALVYQVNHSCTKHTIINISLTHHSEYLK